MYMPYLQQPIEASTSVGYICKQPVVLPRNGSEGVVDYRFGDHRQIRTREFVFIALIAARKVTAKNPNSKSCDIIMQVWRRAE